MLNIIFYKITDKPNVLNKILGSGFELQANVTEFSVIENPRLVCRNMQDFNYCYISEYERYYFVTDIFYKQNGVFEVNCKCDYLMTFANEIKQSKAQCTRSDNPNMYSNGRQIVQDVRPQITDYNLPNNPFTNDMQIVLLTQK